MRPDRLPDRPPRLPRPAEKLDHQVKEENKISVVGEPEKGELPTPWRAIYFPRACFLKSFFPFLVQNNVGSANKDIFE